jgi:hypothetical protein
MKKPAGRKPCGFFVDAQFLQTAATVQPGLHAHAAHAAHTTHVAARHAAAGT